MYDSTNALDIPESAAMVAGYVDGRYRWSDSDWARFPDAVKVRIACFSWTDGGEVLDIESGCSEPESAPDWASRRRAAGGDPSVYVNLANVAAVRAAFDRAGVAQPHYWLASYDGVAVIPEGYIAKQYANPAIIPGNPHYDLSVVADFWPGIDRTNDPEYLGESPAIVTLARGEVGRLRAIFRWPDGRTRTIERKVYAERPGMRFFTIYPPADPDSDPTEDLDAQPGLFIVAVGP